METSQAPDTSQATDTTQTPPPSHRRPTRRADRRRWVVAAALLVLLLLMMRLASLGGDPAVGGSGHGEGTQAYGAAESAAASEAERSEEALDALDDSDVFTDVELVDGDADGGDPGDAGFDPVGDGDPIDPCADHDAGNGDLRVVPDPVVLPSGDLDHSLHVRNCGNGTVHWTAATKPTVTLASAAGTLDPGELTTLGFAIQKDAWEPGAIDFKIKVSEPGHNHYIDVHAFRPLVGADMVGSTDLGVGPHIGGCADQCISKALITRNMSTPDVSLEVGTTVLAKVRVYLSTQPPIIDPAGNPLFPGKPPKATSPDSVQSWTTSLSDLQPATKYFIIVKATDVDGDSAFRSGSFRTITPHEGPGELAPNDLEPGCANQCITKAVVTPGEGLAPSHLSVETHTPAKLQLYLSKQPPTYANGVPSFSDTDVARDSGDAYTESWELDIEGLEPGTQWHGIVRATDANGHRHFAVGSFTTDGVDVLITVQRVHLTQDGDSQSWNRGEVRFAWGVGDDTVGTTGEHKMHGGDDAGFGDHDSYTVHDAREALPTVYVSASERDADGLIEFCTQGTGAHHEPGSNGSCDSKWNVAVGALDFDDIEDLGDCDSMGIDGEWGDEPCMMLVSEDLSDDYPEFWAIVSYTVLD